MHKSKFNVVVVVAVVAVGVAEAALVVVALDSDFLSLEEVFHFFHLHYSLHSVWVVLLLFLACLAA